MATTKFINGAGAPAPRGRLAGFTPDQLHTIFTEIATRANTLGECLREIRERVLTGEKYEVYGAIDMAATAADLLGLLADTPTDGEIKGGAIDWLIGPNFGPAGDEVHHG